MGLIVETGAGLANADAFVSVADFEAWADKRGHAHADYTAAQKEQAIRRATEFMSTAWAWKGYPTKGRNHSDGEQAQAWPRSYVADQYGAAIASDVVPVEVVNATCEVTRRELASPGAMTPDTTPSERLKSEQIGPLRFEYDMSRRDPGGVRPVLLSVQDLIGHLLDHSQGSRVVGRAMRT
jgi:hypothetical protein